MLLKIFEETTLNSIILPNFYKNGYKMLFIKPLII